MLCFDSREDCVAFYRTCEAYAGRRPYKNELTTEFAAWAVLHRTEVRGRVDLLFIDFLRSELGSKGSVRQRILKEAKTDVEATEQASQEEAVFVGQCLDAVDGRDRDILSLHVLSGLSLAEVGKTLSISKTRVRQRLEAAFARLKTTLGNE